MIIDYISDLHIDSYLKIQYNTDLKPSLPLIKKWLESKFGDLLKNKKGEVLVIAGDIASHNLIVKSVLCFFEKYYDKVFFVFGNHDLWLLDIEEELKCNAHSFNKIDLLKKDLKDNTKIVILDNETYEYKGVTFGGSALWYQMYPTYEHSYFTWHNDPTRVLFGDVDMTRVKYIEAMNKRNEEDVNFYKKLMNNPVDVLITHLPPVKIKGSMFPYNPAFQTTVDSLSGSNKWICGHVHVRAEFKVGDTMFYCNPLGYSNEIYGDYEIRSFVV